MHPIIHIFGREIGAYGVLGVLGLFAAGTLGVFLGKKRGISFENAMLMIVAVGIGMLIGGHLLYGLTNIESIVRILSYVGKASFKDILDALLNCFGGMVFYGGFFGSLICTALLVKWVKELKAEDAFDVLAVAVPLFHVFGRIGCFFGGCCYGIPASWGFFIESNPVNPEIAGVTRLPVQLIESGCNLLIFILLLTLFLKGRRRGGLMLVYMAVYAVVRFTLEFFRGDAIRGVFFGLSTSQWISLAILLFIGIRLVISIVKRRRAHGSSEPRT